MKKNLWLILALLVAVLALPGITSAQSDIDGNKYDTEVKIGTLGSNYSDGRSSSTGFLDVTQRLTSNFAIEGDVAGGQYFGSDYAGAGGSILFNPFSGSYLQVGGFRNSQTQTTQVYNLFVEGGMLVYRANEIAGPNGTPIRAGFIKAVEVDYNQMWEGFGITPNTTAVNLYSPRVIFYLPKDWDLMIRGGIVDVIQNGFHNKLPTGGARLRIPITRHVEGTVSAGFDSEGVTNIEQLLNTSTRNYGAGLKVWLNDTTSVEAEGYTSLYTSNHLSGNTYQIVLKKRFGKRQ